MSEPRTVAAVSGAQLAGMLRDATGSILNGLGADHGDAAEWRFETHDETDIEWNGSLAGPSTYAVWRLVVSDCVQAEVRNDTIRWSPSEVHRSEVAGFWKVGERSASLFARAERDGPVTEVRADDEVWDAVWPAATS